MIPPNIKDLDRFDGILWATEKREIGSDIAIGIKAMGYKFENKKPSKPDDLGFKYNILTWNDTPDSGEFISAYIGDIRQFLDNYASLCYSGLMVKVKSVPKRTLKKMFRALLENRNTSKKKVNEILKQVQSNG
jgi:hypothetical protein